MNNRNLNKINLNKFLLRIRNFKYLQNTILIAFLMIVLSFFSFGGFVDEEEKVAASIFAANGLMPYRDVLLNHGPLPFLIAALGYSVIGPFGSIFLLRLLPLILGLLTVDKIRMKVFFRTSLYSTIAQISWFLFLALTWSQGTLRMGIYHGMGGLTATLILIKIYPLVIGRQKLDKLTIFEIVGLCSIMLCLSATFIPFLFMIAIILCTLPKSSKAKIPKALDIKRALTIFLSFLPLASLIYLLISNTIDFNGLYLGHIYFNLNIFAKLNPSPRVLFGPIANFKDFLAAMLAIGVVLMPQIVDAGGKSKKEAKAYMTKKINIHSLLISLSVLTLGYRTGLTSINDFHSLPYFLPASALIIISSAKLLETQSKLVSLEKIKLISKKDV